MDATANRPVEPGFAELMAIRGGGLPDADTVAVTGADPVYPTRFRIGETVAAVQAGIGVAVNDIWELKTGRRQNLAIDVRHAAATMRTSDFTRVRGADGALTAFPADDTLARIRGRMTQPRQTSDGRWFLAHFNLDHLRARVLGVLGCADDPDAVTKAMATWDAQDLEDAIAEARACGTIIRSHDDWLAHPQGRYLAARPVVEVEKIGEADPEPLPGGDRPLSGVRALDLTRILAGPIAGRILAEHGADVLMVTAPHLPQVDEHVRETSHGKRSCFLDLNDAGDARHLKELARTADVFSQGYRPGTIAAKGFGPEELAALRPGIVYLSVNCYGHGGPYRDRAGWEQIGQAASGICHENGGGTPALIPVSACDHMTGNLGAYGILLALARRAREGGSWHVKVSLCQSGMFIFRQGRADVGPGVAGARPEDLAEVMIETDSHHGHMHHLGPVLRMSETPPAWARPTPQLGGDKAAWL